MDSVKMVLRKKKHNESGYTAEYATVIINSKKVTSLVNQGYVLHNLTTLFPLDAVGKVVKLVEKLEVESLGYEVKDK